MIKILIDKDNFPIKKLEKIYRVSPELVKEILLSETRYVELDITESPSLRKMFKAE